MLSLGPHASFIIAAYAVTFVCVAALIFATVGDDLKQRRRLAELERQGIRRRSAGSASATKRPAPKKRTRAAKSPTAKKPSNKAAGRQSAAKRPRAKKTPS